MLIEKKNTADLLPASYNPRKDLKPGDAEYEKLKRSIEQFGYVEPVIWNKTTGRVVGGHQRLKVLIDMGISEVECVVVEIHRIEHDEIVHRQSVHPHALPGLPVYDHIAGRHEIQRADFLANAVYLFRRRIRLFETECDVGINLPQILCRLWSVSDGKIIAHMPYSRANIASTSSGV